MGRPLHCATSLSLPHNVMASHQIWKLHAYEAGQVRKKGPHVAAAMQSAVALLVGALLRAFAPVRISISTILKSITSEKDCLGSTFHPSQCPCENERDHSNPT